MHAWVYSLVLNLSLSLSLSLSLCKSCFWCLLRCTRRIGFWSKDCCLCFICVYTEDHNQLRREHRYKACEKHSSFGDPKPRLVSLLLNINQQLSPEGLGISFSPNNFQVLICANLLLAWRKKAILLKLVSLSCNSRIWTWWWLNCWVSRKWEKLFSWESQVIFHFVFLTESPSFWQFCSCFLLFYFFPSVIYFLSSFPIWEFFFDSKEEKNPWLTYYWVWRFLNVQERYILSYFLPSVHAVRVSMS
jgi:hypothetical protein